jgi:hypothetical protein
MNPPRSAWAVRPVIGLGGRESLLPGEGLEATRWSSIYDFIGTRKLSLGNLRGRGRNKKDSNPCGREPDAVKAARTVLTGGVKKRAGRDRALTLPT